MIIKKPQIYISRNALDTNLITRIERYARVCYKSEDQLAFSGEGSSKFLNSIISLGHESVIEHEKVTVLLIVDRGISHEIVRHRIAAYSQESTRYCRYDRDKFGNEITVIEPFFLLDKEASYNAWYNSCLQAEKAYMTMLAQGCSAQEARSVLPNSLKTEIVVTYNLREWRHFFRLRANAAAHPQMRQVSIPLLRLFQQRLSVLFNDIEYDRDFPEKHYANIIFTDDFFNK
ncbi:MAG: FAD-dependent thymidylate synthase [Syntrophomonadaceae bacterium]|jgi:thymidylate synthase (FAD)